MPKTINLYRRNQTSITDVTERNKDMVIYHSPVDAYLDSLETSIDITERNEDVVIYHSPVDAYLDSLETSSQETMTKVLRSISKIFGFDDMRNVPWHLLNEQVVSRMLASLRSRKLSKHTVAIYLAAIRGVARNAWRMKLITGDTYEAIKDLKPKGEKRVDRGRSVPPRELKALLKVCRDDPRIQGLRDAAMIWTLYGGGLRRAELVGLDLRDLRERDQAILVRGKGNKERLVYLGDEAWSAIQTWIKDVRGSEPGPIFTRIRRKDNLTMDRLSPKAVYYLLEMRCIQAGIDIVRPHDMRRSFISHLLEYGEDIATVQVMAGHASITTTQRYDKRSEKRKKIAANKLSLRDLEDEGDAD